MASTSSAMENRASARSKTPKAKEFTWAWEGRDRAGKAIRGETRAATEVVVQAPQLAVLVLGRLPVGFLDGVNPVLVAHKTNDVTGQPSGH